MTITLEINGIDRTGSISRGSLTKSDVLNQKVDTLGFIVDSHAGTSFEPAVSDTVEMFDDAVTVFKGTILTVRKITEGHTVVKYQVDCVDNGHDLNRVLVNESYENTTINAVAADLVSTYAPDFTTNNVDADIAIESVSFDRISVSAALAKLASLSNYSWYVDYDNDIHFFAKNTELAPFNITDSSNNYIFDSLEVSEDISQLRNRVIIQGGEAEGDDRTEEFDGGKKFYKLSNKFASAPTITVDGNTKTVGVDFLHDEADYDVLWNYNESYIKFPADTPTGTKNIDVTGIPLYDILVQVEDIDSINEHGLSEFAKTDTSIKSTQEAKDFAIAELEAYSQKISEGSFTTYTPGLRSGQTINVNSTLRGINENFLIQRVTFQMLSQNTGIYRVELATLKTITLIDVLISQLRLNGTMIKDSANAILHKFASVKEVIPVAEIFTPRALDYAVTFRLAPQAVTGTSRPFIIGGSPLA